MQDNQQIHSIKNIFIKHNAVIFISVMVGALIFCVFLLNQTLAQTAVTKSSKDSVDTNQTEFDETTKTELQKLQTSENNLGDQALPSGRINPFSE